jgi:tetratricopeptide (TPR) repeat protein
MLPHSLTRRALCVSIAGAALAAPTVAEGQLKTPQRPELPAGADTNDFYAYYRLGFSSIRTDPDKAEAAYYWSARLNPLWAEAYYGRRTALLLREPRMLTRYFQGDRKLLNSPEALAIDSLYVYALTLNPFLGPQLEHLLLEGVIRDVSNRTSYRSGASAGDIQYAIDVALSQGPPESRAMMAYRDGRYDDALKFYGQAISHSAHKGPLLAERGRLFYQIGRADSALANLASAVEEMRKEDKKDLVFIYQSKALMEQRIGMIQHVLGKTAAAKEAYGRALEEDLSYFPAHVQLGYLALESGDTAAATTEMDLAVQIRPNDAGLRYQYGFALGAMNKLKEAEAQLRKSAELDMYYAAPHFVLAQVLSAQSRRAEALKEYDTFMALASHADPRREEAAQELEILKTTNGPSK